MKTRRSTVLSEQSGLSIIKCGLIGLFILVLIMSNTLFFTGAIYALPVFAQSPLSEEGVEIENGDEGNDIGGNDDQGVTEENPTSNDNPTEDPEQFEPGDGSQPTHEDNESQTDSDSGQSEEPPEQPVPEPGQPEQPPMPPDPVMETPDWRELSPEDWKSLSDEVKEQLIRQMVKDWREITPKQWENLPKDVKEAIADKLSEDWRSLTEKDWEMLPKEVREAVINQLLSEIDFLNEEDLLLLPIDVLFELVQLKEQQLKEQNVKLMVSGNPFPKEPEVGGFVIHVKKLTGKNLFTQSLLAPTSTRLLEPQAELNLDNVTIYGLRLYKNFTVQDIPFHLEIKTKNPDDLVRITSTTLLGKDLENRISEMYAKRMRATVLGLIPITLNDYWTTHPEVDLLLKLSNLLSFAISVDVDDMLLNTHMMKAEKITIHNLELNVGWGHLDSYVQ